MTAMWQSMLVTNHMQVSTRSVCRTMLTEYVRDKAHTGFYAPCLSYNAERVCWWKSTYRFLRAVFVVQCWQSMLVTKHTQVSTRRVCRTMLREYVDEKAHTGFYTPCLSYNADRVCLLQNTHRFPFAVFVLKWWQSMFVTNHTGFYTRCLSYSADRLCLLQNTHMFLHAVVVVQYWQSMLVTKYIQVSTRRVCRTILTEYVGYKAHTGFYTQYLSYKIDSAWSIIFMLVKQYSFGKKMYFTKII